jgi:DNA modification methylase
MSSEAPLTGKTAQTRPSGKKAAPVAAKPGEGWPADAVERRPVDSLVPYARNARTHSPEQVAQIAASIREWGWTMPVLVDEQSTIIAGHGRVVAAQQLGLAEVPVMVARGWSEAQKQAYVIADNKLALNAGWNEDLLRIELGELRGLGTDLGLTGFGEIELEALFAGANDSGPDPDEAPEIPVNPVSRPGDLWTCGEHRVLCGDATVFADVEKVLGGELADMCFTDPPYGVNYANSAKDKQRGKHRPILNDHPGDGFESMLRAASANVLAATKGAVYVCMSSSELDTLQRAFREAGGRWSTFVIWAKHTFTLGRADYQRQYEPILYGWKDGTDHFWCGARDQGDVWFFDKPSRNDLHPTMKPVALVERAIRNSSKSRDVVLDPFGGSGTTMIAAERLSRRARLIELDPKYVDVIVQRWQSFTGGTVTLGHTGQTFAEVAASRLLAIAPAAKVTEEGASV